MNLKEKLFQREAICSNLMDAVIFILQENHSDLLNKVIEKHLELCEEWDSKRDEK